MALFYFHLHDRYGETRDLEGTELADLAAARRHAVAEIRALISSDVRDGIFDLHGSLEITDAAGARLLRVGFAESLLRVI